MLPAHAVHLLRCRASEALAQFTEVVRASLDAISNGSSSDAAASTDNGASAGAAKASPTTKAAKPAETTPAAKQEAAVAADAAADAPVPARHALAAAVAADVLAADSAPAVEAAPAADSAPAEERSGATASKGSGKGAVVLPSQAEAAVSEGVGGRGGVGQTRQGGRQVRGTRRPPSAALTVPPTPADLVFP